MATITKGYSFGATETVTSAKLSTLVDSASISNIVEADISSSAITNIKINDVSGAKFTNLSEIFSGAGVIPLANGGTGQSTLAGFLNLIYPVGSIYTNASNSTNPGTLLGFGTWTAFGAGRSIICYDSGQTEFDTAEETGGAKTHTLDISEIPAHTHSLLTYNDGTSGNVAKSASANNPTGGVTGLAGGGAAHNNLHPYIVAYVWKRVS